MSGLRLHWPAIFHRRRKELGGGGLSAWRSFYPGDSVAAKGGTFTRAGLRTYIDSSRIVQTAGSGVLIDSHYIGGVRHVLVQPARTNSVLFSEDFSNAVWSMANLVIAGGSITCPDGNAHTTVSLVVAAGSWVSAPILQSVAGWTASNPQTTSVFAKAGSSPVLAMYHVDKNNANHASYVNLTNGTVGTTDASHVIGVTALANGWYRISARLSSSGTGAFTTYIEFAPCDSDGSRSVTGDGATVNTYLWGAQHEIDAAWSTTYIPTSSATVTSVVDRLTIPHGLGATVLVTLFLDHTDLGMTFQQFQTYPVSLGGGANVLYIYNGGSIGGVLPGSRGNIGAGGADVQSLPAVSLPTTPQSLHIEQRSTLRSDSKLVGSYVHSSGAEQTGVASPASGALGSAWGSTDWGIANTLDRSSGLAIRGAKLLLGEYDIPTCRSYT